MEKLVKIQSELKAPKGQFNAFGKYKYRNCEDILEAVKPLLKKHGCSIALHDEIKEICGVIYVEATATIYDVEADKVINGVKAQAGIDIHKKGMDIAQTFGSSSSYARKYALNGLLLIDDTKDADTKDNSAPKEPAKEALTTERFKKALKLIEENKYSAEELKSKHSLSQTQLDQLNKLITPKNDK